jgi:choline-sulfatase
VDFGHYYDYLGRKIEIFTRGMEADDSGKGCPWIDLYQDPDNAWNLVPAKASLATQLPDKDQFEAFVVREALRFLHTYREFPVFLFVSFLRPHTPLVVPPQYRDRYPLDKIRLPATAHENASCLNAYLRSRVVEGIETPEGQTLARQHLQRYGAAVSYVDDQFGVLMAGLRELGMDDQAAIVYTSDHGDMLFEHGMLGKFTFYEASAKVPFIFHLPGQTQGVVTNFVIDHTRLLPSLLDLAELPVPDLDGASLLPEISTAKSETKANPQGTAFSELSLAQDTTIRMIRKGVYKYCEYQQGYKQLFDLERDPDERVNLASQGMAVERELAQELHAHTRAMEVTRPNLAGPNPRF